MLHAASFALLDSINALLIGVLVVLGVMYGPRGRFGVTAALLIVGDWLGVFSLALVTVFVFGGLEELVQSFMESPAFGLILIAIGVVSLIATWRASADSTVALVRRVARPLRQPGWAVPAIGFVLGVVQSVTSGPFFAGIAYVAVAGLSATQKVGAMVAYAAVALSLPTLSALVVGWVRHFPESPLGRGFQWARDNQQRAIDAGGYGVGIVLTAMGIAALF